MDKCFEPILVTTFNNEEILIDLSNKETPILSEKIQTHKYYYSYYYDEDENNPYFEIYTTDLCNMDCPYCFNRYSENLKISSPCYDISDLIKFIKVKSPNGELGIKFSGGEPLLNKNWIYKVVEELDKENLIVNYNINTNITLIDDDFLYFAKKHNFFVIASVDGGNDPYKGGKFKNLILKNIIDLVNARIIATGRMVFWPNHEQSLKDLVMQSLGTGLEAVSISLPFGKCGGKEELELLEDNLQEFAEFYLDKVLNKNLHYIGVSPFILYIRHFIIDQKFWKDNCSAGKDIYSIDMKGDIYPCHCFSGINKFYSGNIFKSDFTEKKFSDYNVDNIKPCNNCEIRYICKAKCYADNFYSNNDILKANKFRCDCEKRIVSCSAYILKKIMEVPEIYPLFKYAVKKGVKKINNKK